jgi:hypothetical protein
MSRVRRLAAVTTIGGMSLNLIGCATIINGRTQDVPVSSIPSGASVRTEGIQATTPATLTLKRDTEHTVVVSHDGLPERQVKLDRKISGVVLREPPDRRPNGHHYRCCEWRLVATRSGSHRH